MLILVSSSLVFAQSKNYSDTSVLSPLEIISLRANSITPVAKTDLRKSDIEQMNTGVDLPFILQQTPSVVANSDAGNGIGYTGIRIRGTDATRINVTINGIPYNDAESQGTFLVNLPDISSSVQSIQIQRGVGSSTNGAGAFGASINLQTNMVDSGKYLQIINSLGSFDSRKHTLIFNSGLKNGLLFNARISQIGSEGYIDRAATRLQSFYTSIAYIQKNNSLRLNVFSGKEKTYAAWFGINQETLDTNRTYNPAGTEKSGTPYHNETDNYSQTHYQAFYNQKINNKIQFNISSFLTTGKGYFEQYKANQSFASYGLPNYLNFTETDLVRQLWLDNRFYGTVFSMQLEHGANTIQAGGLLSFYDGKHFGKIIEASIPNAIQNPYEWYRLKANKREQSFYGKWTRKLSAHLFSYLDLQSRNVQYNLFGFRNNPSIIVQKKWNFINPKAGITYVKKNWQAHLSYARAAKEPNRDDFETSPTDAPKPEDLHDIEAGFRKYFGKNCFISINGFYMHYRNQLVLTGKVNDVFAYTRSNIPKSYRAGMELEGGVSLYPWLNIQANATLSQNKITSFTEYIDNYDLGNQETVAHGKTDISFSPDFIAGMTVDALIAPRMHVLAFTKHVGRQFLDNTSHKERMLKAYTVQDIKWTYQLSIKKLKTMDVFVQLNNIFSTKYVANGWTYTYISGGERSTENYYFPMATFNWMAGLNITL
jgi:iron complex outermembrane receptor protein